MYLGITFWLSAILIFSPLYYVSEGNDDLEAKILKKSPMELYMMLKKSGENMAFSPTSLQIAIASAYAGAKGITAKEIKDAFQFPSRNETLNDHFEIIKYLSIPVLKLANRVYVNESLVLEKEYEDDLKKNFLFTTGRVSFNNVVGAIEKINAWVTSQTNNKIKNIVDSNALTTDTRVVLLNAMYFKADWKYQFEPLLNSSSLNKFHVSKDQSIDVVMMLQNKNFQNAHSVQLKAKILALPYAVKQLEMIIILPDEIDGLEQVEEKVANNSMMSDIMNSLEVDQILVCLPKFKTESSFQNLRETLINLGITDLFSNADLSGISKEKLYVNEVIQKSFVEINEKGTEAADAAGVQGLLKSNLTSKKFIADHPFMYIITKGGLILFQGRFVKPSSIE